MSIVLLQTHSLVLSWIACTDSIVIPRIYSKHEERCDSPVAPQAKAPDCYVNSTGSLTPILHLERKVEFHVSTRDEAWLPCWSSIGTPRAMSDLESSPEVPASTQGGPMPLHQMERNLKKPLVTRMEVWLFTGKISGPWGPQQNSRETSSILPQLEKNQEILSSMPDEALSAAASWEKSHLPSWASKGYLTPVMQLKKFPDIPVCTPEEHWDSQQNSRTDTFFPPHLEMRVHFPASSAKQSRCSRCTSRGSQSHPETPEELQGSIHNLKRPRCPRPLKIRPSSHATTRMRPQVSTHNTKEGLRAPWHL